MKRWISVSLTLLSLAFSAEAQDLYSAMEIGENLYYGTARSMAMGNAMTSLGGDLGSIEINPAGSAVSRFNQIALSPGLSISSTTAAYAPTYSPADGIRESDFTGREKTARTNFIFPNGGVNFYIDMDRNRGLRGISVGLVCNNTHSYMNSYSARGVNPYSSLTGAIAYRADGVPYKTYLDKGAYKDYSLDYFAVMGAGCGMIQPVGLLNDVYRGTAEEFDEDGKLSIPGDLSQVSNVSTFGCKTDLVFNVGFDIDSQWYLGVNIGIPFLTYQYNENFRESTVNAREFSEYSYSLYDYSMSRQGSGIYAKVGAIWLPFKGMRVGFAAQTPVGMNVVDRYSLDGSCSFTDGDYRSDGGDRGNSYYVRLPYRLNAGLSYSFSGVALVSADYEMADYSITRYSSTGGGGSNLFREENMMNRLFMGVSHNFRAGVEVHLGQMFALRLGYGFITTPLCYYENCSFDMAPIGNIYPEDFSCNMYDLGRLTLGNRKFFSDFKHSFSGGLGFSSAGSFFADVALRCTRFNTSDFVPYNDYIFDGDGGVLTPSPTVRSRKDLWDVVLTIGWRF